MSEAKQLQTSDGAQTIEEAEDMEADLLANLSDEKDVAVRLDQIKHATIEPGLMRLPVEFVEVGENNKKLVIELFHPAEKNPRFYLPLPTMWQPDKESLPMLMDWYGYSTSNYYHLQTDRLYVRHGKTSGRCIEAGPNQDWAIVPPPEWSPPRLDRFKHSAKRKLSCLKNPPLLLSLYFIGQVIAVGSLTILAGIGLTTSAMISTVFLIISLWLYGVVTAFKESM